MKWTRPIFAIVSCLALAACGHVAAPSEVVHDKVYVPTPIACPDASTYAKITAARPDPLRNHPMPADVDVRVAKQAAQLGLYEAPGGYADQAQAALDRCQKP